MRECRLPSSVKEMGYDGTRLVPRVYAVLSPARTEVLQRPGADGSFSGPVKDESGAFCWPRRSISARRSLFQARLRWSPTKRGVSIRLSLAGGQYAPSRRRKVSNRPAVRPRGNVFVDSRRAMLGVRFSFSQSEKAIAGLRFTSQKEQSCRQSAGDSQQHEEFFRWPHCVPPPWVVQDAAHSVDRFYGIVNSPAADGKLVSIDVRDQNDVTITPIGTIGTYGCTAVALSSQGTCMASAAPATSLIHNTNTAA